MYNSFFPGLISGVQYNSYVSAINGVSERNTSSLILASTPPPVSIAVIIVIVVVLVVTLAALFLSVTCIM